MPLGVFVADIDRMNHHREQRAADAFLIVGPRADQPASSARTRKALNVQAAGIAPKSVRHGGGFGSVVEAQHGGIGSDIGTISVGAGLRPHKPMRSLLSREGTSTTSSASKIESFPAPPTTASLAPKVPQPPRQLFDRATLLQQIAVKFPSRGEGGMPAATARVEPRGHSATAPTLLPSIAQRRAQESHAPHKDPELVREDDREFSGRQVGGSAHASGAAQVYRRPKPPMVPRHHTTRAKKAPTSATAPHQHDKDAAKRSNDPPLSPDTLKKLAREHVKFQVNTHKRFVPCAPMACQNTTLALSSATASNTASIASPQSAGAVFGGAALMSSFQQSHALLPPSHDRNPSVPHPVPEAPTTPPLDTNASAQLWGDDIFHAKPQHSDEPGLFVPQDSDIPVLAETVECLALSARRDYEGMYRDMRRRSTLVIGMY